MAVPDVAVVEGIRRGKVVKDLSCDIDTFFIVKKVIRVGDDGDHLCLPVSRAPLIADKEGGGLYFAARTAIVTGSAQYGTFVHRVIGNLVAFGRVIFGIFSQEFTVEAVGHIGPHGMDIFPCRDIGDFYTAFVNIGVFCTPHGFRAVQSIVDLIGRRTDGQRKRILVKTGRS